MVLLVLLRQLAERKVVSARIEAARFTNYSAVPAGHREVHAAAVAHQAEVTSRSSGFGMLMQII